MRAPSDATPLRVSIVTPCLNPGARLTRCIDSVAAQTAGAVEHVVVDGGSTDGTLDLLAQSAVRWISEPDSGQADAINKGFALACGEIVGWLNADDALEPDAVERSLPAFAAGAVWTYGDCRVVRGGSLVNVWRPTRRFSLEAMERGEVVPQPGSLVRADVLEALGFLDESFHLAMDVELWIRLLVERAPYEYVPSVLAEFELHPDSKTESLGLAPFYEEAAAAFAKHRLPTAAALSLGRSCAYRAGLDPRALEAAVGDATRRAAGEAWPGEAVRAGALAEAAVIALRERRWGRVLRLGLDPGAWRMPQARARLVAASRRFVAGRVPIRSFRVFR